jgi:hypothetical protein
LTSDRSFTGDLLESFRWIADVAVMDAFESGLLDLPGFYFTGDDYRYRFEPEAKRRFVEVLREQFNSGAVYKGRSMKWDTMIQEKASELGRSFSGRSRTLDFSDPSPVLERTDNRAIREAILTLTQSEARKRGIGNSTLHYLRKNARDVQAFKVSGKVLERLGGLQ